MCVDHLRLILSIFQLATRNNTFWVKALEEAIYEKVLGKINQLQLYRFIVIMHTKLWIEVARLVLSGLTGCAAILGVKVISMLQSFSNKRLTDVLCFCVLSQQSRLSLLRFWEETLLQISSLQAEMGRSKMQAARPRRLPPPPPPPPTHNAHIHAPCSLVHPVHGFIKHSERGVLEICECLYVVRPPNTAPCNRYSCI